MFKKSKNNQYHEGTVNLTREQCAGKKDGGRGVGETVLTSVEIRKSTSNQIAGVTALCDSGEPLENVAIGGRWRMVTTPLNCKQEF